jgi:LDH2 family malate/lactate/ureidoglycolate dehydrogenase
MTTHSIAAPVLTDWVRELLQAQGVSASDAQITADSLVSADVEGVASHGVMLLPMYLDRLRAGSVKAHARPCVVEDLGGLVVMSAQQALGQVSSQIAVRLAVERAQVHGLSAVTVRDAFHFGAASFWARQVAAAHMIGMAFSNTRPLMPAPGGAERVVGNNPVAMAFPSVSGDPLVVDMAMSATAMGKIRLADAKGQAIPQGWATDAQGEPTTSAAQAIAGMLLPAAGPKGFGLAVAIDLLCGALSGGGVGAQVQPLYGDAATPYNCAHTFITIDASRLHGGRGVDSEVSAFAQVIRQSKRAPGVETIYAPGDLERARRQEHAQGVLLGADLVDKLQQEAQRSGLKTRLVG